MKTTIELPNDMFRAVQAAALMRGQTLKQLLTSAVEHELKCVHPVGLHDVSDRLQGERAAAFRLKLEALARQNAAAWGSEKSALQQLQEDRDARGY
ncbi:MAG: hypothetical protein WC091_06825 [Sulfuricellaceae bacterium]